jgi:hypothetical protein
MMLGMRWIALWVVALVGTAVAQPATWVDVFNPSEERMKQVCDEGYENGEKKDALLSLVLGLKYVHQSTAELGPLDKLRIPRLTIELQPPLAQVYLLCRSQARSLKPKSYTGSTILQMTAVVILGGEVKDLKYAKDWAVALSIRNKDGEEITRLLPSSKVVGDAQRWSLDCSKSGCVWKGSNYYGFVLRKEDLDSMERLFILYQLGSGVKEDEVLLKTLQK